MNNWEILGKPVSKPSITLDEEKCRELKMGSYLAVAAASNNPPKFIHIKYKPPSGQTNVKLAIVGKGLTFDR